MGLPSASRTIPLIVLRAGSASVAVGVRVGRVGRGGTVGVVVAVGIGGALVTRLVGARVRVGCGVQVGGSVKALKRVRVGTGRSVRLPHAARMIRDTKISAILSSRFMNLPSNARLLCPYFSTKPNTQAVETSLGWKYRVFRLWIAWTGPILTRVEPLPVST
jgi:hypothetical protein